ncbi:hypothetical protein AMELA_G00066470 [Ameiurus melas]|uniref:Uncharacterized protein n=1 Tax=Ameiurus melas TaxID=219545 RepID=A0A7J6B5X7_AMEME|nr:hypothetical protein AMELA_G00066470 [Ameiurus melas]
MSPLEPNCACVADSCQSVLRMRGPFKHFLHTHTHTHRPLRNGVKILCADPSILIIRSRTRVENLSTTSPWLSAISHSVVR